MTLEELRELIAERMKRDQRLRAILKRIEAGKATAQDSFTYSRIAAEIMADELSGAVLSLDDRETVCTALLHDRYADTMEQADAVQRILDAKNGLHMQPRRPLFPAERVQQIAHSLVQPDVPDEKIVRRAGSTATVAMSFHDDFVKENARFRSRAGLKCYITRVTDGKCCPWCADVAGRYRYGEEPGDIYRRHDNCGCTVTFENGRKRQDVWSKRGWEAPEPGAGAGDLVVFTKEQAEALQAEHGLTKLVESGRINAKIKHRMMNFYDEDFYNPYTSDEIEEELQFSPIGRYVSHWIEYDGYSIEMNYDKNASKNLCGEIRDKRITVYPRNHDNAQEISETIIHEFAHEKFEWVDTQENEVNCRIYEYLHSHDTISKDQISEIVKFVKEEYSELPEGDLYGY